MITGLFREVPVLAALAFVVAASQIGPIYMAVGVAILFVTIVAVA